MAIKPHTGFMRTELGLTGAVILTILIDRITKKDADPVTMSELSQATLAGSDQIKESIQLLVDKGLIKIGSGELHQAGSFRIGGLQIKIESDQRAFPEEDKPKANDLAAPAKVRDETGEDEVDLGGFNYLGTVEYEAEEHPGRYQLTVGKKSVEDPASAFEDVLFADFETREEAWRAFDNFVQRDSRSETFEMSHLAQDGTKWEATFTRENPDEEEVPDYLLRIFRTLPDEAVSTKVVEDKFDSANEAWTHVDEYLGLDESGEPIVAAAEASEPAGEVALEVLEGGERKPTVTAETGGVKWKYYSEDGKKKGAVDRFDLEFPDGRTVSKEIPSKEVLADSRSIEEIATSLIGAEKEAVPF